MTSRYFQNHYSSEGQVDISKELYKNRILSCVDQILEGAKPTIKNGEKGVYTGTAGIAYAFYHLIKSKIFPDQNDKFLKIAESYITVALDANSIRSRKDVGLLSGNGGVYLVAALIYNEKSDDEKCEKYLQSYRELAILCEPLEFLEGGCDELFVGRAGYLLGIYLLQRELKREILLCSQIHLLCGKVIESGKKLGRETKFSGNLPLMYKYHSKPYLGAAHGFAGILQAVLCFPTYLSVEPDSAVAIEETVNFLLNRCLINGNVATNLDGAMSSRGKYLVHWCHGAAGIVYMFARAYLVFGRDEKYLNACRVLADTVWKEGLLKKGPGICHGVAGSGFVFLLMHRLTGEQKYLYRAERFASFLFTEQFNSEARTPDRPLSLFEGLSGTLCYLVDLLQPDKAELPLSDVFLE